MSVQSAKAVETRRGTASASAECEDGVGRRRGASKPRHKKCGMALARMYYAVYDQSNRGSKIFSLPDWMWCAECMTPVHMIQCDLGAHGARPAGNEWRRRQK